MDKVEIQGLAIAFVGVLAQPILRDNVGRTAALIVASIAVIAGLVIAARLPRRA